MELPKWFPENKVSKLLIVCSYLLSCSLTTNAWLSLSMFGVLILTWQFWRTASCLWGWCWPNSECPTRRRHGHPPFVQSGEGNHIGTIVIFHRKTKNNQCSSLLVLDRQTRKQRWGRSWFQGLWLDICLWFRHNRHGLIRKPRVWTLGGELLVKFQKKS